MERNASPTRGYAMSWEREDIERRIGFIGGKFTEAGLFLPFLLGLGLTVLFYLYLLLLEHPTLQGTFLASIPPMFFERGMIPYIETLFTGWALGILLVKWQKLQFQRRALTLDVVPDTGDFVLSPETADQIIDTIERKVDDPHRFVLFSRIVTVLSNLRNMGRISDVDDMLARQADIVEDMTDSGYSLLKGFVWAIPVLGFIGTVVGLSAAVGSFGGVLAEGTGFDELKLGLQRITGGLAVAFDTTFIGLVQALFVQLLMIAEKRSEHRFLDDCRDYCHRNLVARLRILPLEDE